MKWHWKISLTQCLIYPYKMMNANPTCMNTSLSQSTNVLNVSLIMCIIIRISPTVSFILYFTLLSHLSTHALEKLNSYFFFFAKDTADRVQVSIQNGNKLKCTLKKNLSNPPSHTILWNIIFLYETLERNSTQYDRIEQQRSNFFYD